MRRVAPSRHGYPSFVSSTLGPLSEGAVRKETLLQSLDPPGCSVCISLHSPNWEGLSLFTQLVGPHVLTDSLHSRLCVQFGAYRKEEGISSTLKLRE